MIIQHLRTEETKFTSIEKVFSFFGYINLIRIKTCYKSNYGRWKTQYKIYLGNLK